MLFRSDSYYGLPDDITITVKGKELNKGEGYRYNSTTGEIIINENDVQGSIIIKAVAKDVTAPQACITLNENQWNMEGDTDIIVYYKTVPQIASITATDYGDGIKSIEYGILQMPKSDENPVKWIDYESAKGISIEEDGTYIIYVRVTDYNNNVCFINSSTIMVDSKAPSIEDLIDNGVYYGSKAFVVPDDATQVTVDGVNIEFDQYLIELPADNNEHIIIITDQSGNTMEYRIVLYGEYVISYLPGIDGIGSKLEEVRYGDTSEYKIKDALYTRKGYTQIGWSTRENDKASLYVYGQEYNENSNLTLYPVWKKNVVTVIGNISNSDSLKDTILYGAEYSVTIKPITGYTFPRSVTIKCDNNILKVNEDYEYNPLTGVIKIYLNKAVGNITIIADAVKVINSQVKPDASKIGLVGPTYIDSDRKSVV